MSWIPYTSDLPGKPEVARIAKLSGRSIRETVAILLEFWAWADEQIVVDACVDADVDGVVDGGVDIDLTQIVRDTDATLWDAVRSVGWLRYDPAGCLVIPHFTRWMTETTKSRMLRSLRQNRWRKRKARVDDGVDGGVDGGVDASSTQKRRLQNKTEQDREEEKKKKEKSASPPLSADADPSLPILTSENGHLGPTAEELMVLWNLLQCVKCDKIAGKRRTVLTARNRDPYFREHWRAAIAHVPDCPFLLGENDRGWTADIDWFLRPDSVLKILEGKYDAREPAAKSGFLADLFGEKK